MKELETGNYSFGNITLTFEEIIKLLDYKPDTRSTENLLTNCLTVAAYSLIVFVSFLGNVLVCKVSLENRTTTNSLIASLAASDLLVTVFNIPFNVARLLMEEWPFGQLLCFLVPFVQVMAVYVSSFTMAVIAIHRWRSVTSTTITSCSKRSLWATIIATWTLSALMAIPLSIFNKTQIFFTYKPLIRCRVVYPPSDINIALLLTIECFLTQYVIPLSLACIIYGKIAIVIAKQGRIANLRGKTESKRRSDRKRRRILMLVLVVAVFAICWLPINCYHLLVDFKVIEHTYFLFIMCHWFAMSSVCYNPFIYCWLNSTFRNGAKNFFCYIFHLCGRRQLNAVSLSRRRSSVNDNDTKLDTMVTATTNLNQKKCSIVLQEIADNGNCNALSANNAASHAKDGGVEDKV